MESAQQKLSPARSRSSDLREIAGQCSRTMKSRTLFRSKDVALLTSLGELIQLAISNLGDIADRNGYGESDYFVAASLSQDCQNAFISSGWPSEMRAYVSIGGKGRPMRMLSFLK
jgi:hypothetical protein